MYSIQQVTNFSDVVKNAPVTSRVIDEKNVLYYTLQAGDLTRNGSALLKLGYTCEPKGSQYPIYLMVQNSYKEIWIGITGMFEIQPEIFKNINEESAEDIELIPRVTAIQVPKDIVFKLDYAYSMN